MAVAACQLPPGCPPACALARLLRLGLSAGPPAACHAPSTPCAEAASESLHCLMRVFWVLACPLAPPKSMASPPGCPQAPQWLVDSAGADWLLMPVMRPQPAGPGPVGSLLLAPLAAISEALETEGSRLSPSLLLGCSRQVGSMPGARMSQVGERMHRCRPACSSRPEETSLPYTLRSLPRPCRA